MSLKAALDLFSRECSAIRSSLQAADAESLSRIARVSHQAAVRKACAYLWLSASVEGFVDQSLLSILAELESRHVPLAHLKRGLIALSLESKFQSLRDIRNLEKSWDCRIEVLESSSSLDRATFPEGLLPLDPRTLRPYHFKVIWRVFGFEGVSIPTPRHAMQLRDLAEGRNELAHGRTTFEQFGRRKVIREIIRLLEGIEEIGLNLYTEGTEYLRACPRSHVDA
jgi:hypothetical protein